MKPYYEDDLVTLYHGDCLEIDAWLEADVLITDPPYGVGGKLSKADRKGTAVHGLQGWDLTLDVRDRVLALWGDKPYAVFGSPRRLDSMPRHREVPLVWDKGNMPAMGDTSFPWRPTYELVYVAGPGWTGARGEAVLRYDHKTQTASKVGHPSAKPIPLMQHLVAKAPAGVIADPFAGSGSTAVAARREGRRAICVEMDERYCEIAATRLSQQAFNFDDLLGGDAA